MGSLKDLTEILAATGGYGLAAIFAWLFFRKDREVAELQKEIRTEMKLTAEKLLVAVTENNLIARHQADAFQRLSDRIGGGK